MTEKCFGGDGLIGRRMY